MLSSAPVAQLYCSFDLHAYLRREARLLGKQGDLPPLPLAMSACVAGISWTIDGVSFRFVWPASSITRKPPGKRRGGKSKRNDDACVLLVRGAHHSALLTSDIGVRQEAFLLDGGRSEEHTSELQSLMRISYAVFCLKKKQTIGITQG